jgi:hypothetical protein
MLEEWKQLEAPKAPLQKGVIRSARYDREGDPSITHGLDEFDRAINWPGVRCRLAHDVPDGLIDMISIEEYLE